MLIQFLIIILPLLVSGQNLEVVTTNTKLPTARTEIPVVYDGEDSIYLLGGRINVEVWEYDILKYSISDETIETIGTMPSGSGSGSAVSTHNNGFVFFGGRNFSATNSRIYRVSIDNPSNWTVLNELPEACYGTEGIRDDQGNVYVIGGITTRLEPYVGLDTITKYSTINNQVEVVAHLPGQRYGVSAVWDNRTGHAYIFGGIQPNFIYMDQILKFDISTGSVSVLSVFMPVGATSSCAVWTGAEAYVIGGFNLRVERYVPITTFDPQLGQINIPQVDNFPDELYGTACVFVEKLNRIYLFGGRYGELAKYTDNIMYIDLTQGQPTTTRPGPDYCLGLEDGTFVPNLYCCESYYVCQNQQSILHQCQPGLQYSPLVKRCDSADIVQCSLAYGKN